MSGIRRGATTHAPLLWTGQQALRGLAEQLPGGLPVEGVEAPLPTPLLAHQPGVLELPHVVGDLRLAHADVALELADADALVLLARRYTRAGEVAAPPTLGHHAEHPHPYGVGESLAQGDEPVHPFLGAIPTEGVLFYDPELFSAHRVPRSAGLRPLMKALASRTSVAAAVSPQHPEPPQHPEAANSSS